MRDQCLYDVLQVRHDAEPEVIRAAYQGLAKKYHPDRTGDERTTDRMREINLAYEVLSDPIRRLSYDKALKEEDAREAAASQKSSPDAIPDALIRQTLLMHLPPGGVIDRETLLQSAANQLGFEKLTKRLRHRLNTALTDARSDGRLDTDWQLVWRV